MADDIRDRAVAIYDRFRHEHHDRRTLLREMTLLTGSAFAAEVLVGGIAASTAAVVIIAPAEKRLKTFSNARVPVAGGEPIEGYIATPLGKRPTATVLVFHENRGLTPHLQDVARGVALAGFFAIAPDFLSDAGGRPTDEDRVRYNRRGEPRHDRRRGGRRPAAFCRLENAAVACRRDRPLLGRRACQPCAIAAGDRLSAGVA
ncbi:dienelactone hydrolase family protein [Sphingomonas sp. Mn802worker]|uniref:dienelactone hydrolase family protein n=1 Tax=Sphingomonas sp. Mn802worker TaxID=629773 RepID=UPI00039CF7AE|nr:dienelactone hydrolase family protein [Sphingomonas sp. Mn802worker]